MRRDKPAWFSPVRVLDTPPPVLSDFAPLKKLGQKNQFWFTDHRVTPADDLAESEARRHEQHALRPAAAEALRAVARQPRHYVQVVQLSLESYSPFVKFLQVKMTKLCSQYCL